ncbi:ribonuclease P protein component [Gluconobacter sp. LMG 1744]|uniref:ribonuclease P protein component n=1 Tax=Gluconobacter TaxID=441 RepID=UPI0018858386|nr:ribonuclease P protein component [Gluconobacter cadivus]MBF0890083.1 ribonuclease P protein component [Gluconobacter cadivus]MBS1073566.1 ribonuclease P protein component [Gluconobacter sp. Dm-73]MBS1090356.1 ribonuclease P protein component [Gluconobacter sp. Dm-74]
MGTTHTPSRLKKRPQFLRVAGKGRKVATPGMVVQILPDDTATETRVGFTVTKKVGNSVIRNRTRRRLREALRLVAREDGLPSGDFVLIGRDKTRGREFSLLKDDLRQALRKGLDVNFREKPSGNPNHARNRTK